MNYAFINGIILNGHQDMKPLAGHAILTKGDKIQAITSDMSDLKGYELIDLKGDYILPGLIDMHVHLALQGDLYIVDELLEEYTNS